MITLRACKQCGKQFPAKRETALYCSPSCRKAASRTDGLEKATDGAIYDLLRRKGLVAKVWPVFRWDVSPSVYALMVPRAAAVVELNAHLAVPITEGDLARVLRANSVAEGPVEKKLIAEFHQARKDRKIAA